MFYTLGIYWTVVERVYHWDKTCLLCTLSFNSYLSLLTVIKVLFLEFLWPSHWPHWLAQCSLWQISYLYSVWAHCISPWWPELLIITKRWENIYLFVTIALIMDEYILWERSGPDGGGRGDLTMWPNVGDSWGRNNTVQLVTTYNIRYSSNIRKVFLLLTTCDM